MSQWSSSDSGILRKNRVEENLDQLLVFGYSCKIFRDDEKALFIDQGKHLIPWMGQESLRIDRYDGRGTLSDLKKFEASREDYDTLRWLGLSESEKKLEELCDSERYYSLQINEEEEEMYKEEAAKREKTNAIAFNYNQPSNPEPKEGVPTVPEKEEEDEPYKPSPVLDVPVDINIPKTLKEYARIEKTALFVCRQGPQMEILIKAKQADNPQFSFLTVQDPLYKFYRHLLGAFKNGRYQPQCGKKPDESQAEPSQDSDQDSHYLHPSLVATSGKPGTPPLGQSRLSLPYRPSADCAYSQLVNRIQGSNGQSEPLITQQPSVANQMQLMNQMTLEQQYHQYYYVQQFYEYWRHSVINSEQGAAYAGLPADFSRLDPNMQSYIHHLAWGHFVEQHKQVQDTQQPAASADNNSYAQIVSNLNKDNVNPYTANVPLLPPIEPAKEEPKNTAENEGLLSLAAAYGSGSDSDTSGSESDEESAEACSMPPTDMQTVIDKMAEYVSKNGEQFEAIIKQKQDHRFVFLNNDHKYHRYYKSKLESLTNKAKAPQLKNPAPKPKQKKPIAPVSFSIKKPKEEPSKEIKSALPVEDSSEEDSCTDTGPKSPSEPLKLNNNTSSTTKEAANPKTIYNSGQTLPSQVEPDKLETQAASVEDLTASPPNPPKPPSSTPKRSRTPKKRSRSRTSSPVPLKRAKSRSKTPSTKPRTKRKSPAIDMFETEEAKKTNGGLDDDPILELIDLENDDRTAKEKAEDAKARQLERKRKAAMFLKLKSVASSSRRTHTSKRRASSTSPVNSRRNSADSIISIRSRSRTRERSSTKRSRRSRERRKEDKKHKKSRAKDRSRSNESSRKRRDKKKKRKRSKSRKKSRKHKRSRSPVRRSRSSSVKSHISINSS
uniref:SURP motif domain-containing protein n=1 Tax=Dendroctonus ponderosae TaxID=77166 RepID=A0AAR5Q7R9_DENPD